jgi:hypothetical protein
MMEASVGSATMLLCPSSFLPRAIDAFSVAAAMGIRAVGRSAQMAAQRSHSVWRCRWRHAPASVARPIG